MGLVARRAGHVELRRQAHRPLPPYRIARLGLGYVPEERRIFTELSVMENLEVGASRARDGAPPWTETSSSRCSPISARMRERPGGRMSGGEQQMLTIARTLMGNPSCVLLDEPSEGLAPIIVEQMAQSILALKAEGMCDPAVASRTCISASPSPTAPTSSRKARSASAARWPSSARDASLREQYLSV